MKKAICIALVVALIVLIFCGPLAQESKAFAASVAVIGAVIAVMALCGITLAASGLTAAEIQSYIGNKLDEWASDMGQPLDHLINSAGIGMTISGLLQIGSAAAQGINNFISWFVQNDSITSNSSQNVIEQASTFSGVEVVRVYQLENYNVRGDLDYVLLYIVSSGDVYAYRVQQENVDPTVVLVSDNDFVLLAVQYRGDTVTSTRTVSINRTDYGVYWANIAFVRTQNDVSFIPNVTDGRDWAQVLGSLRAGQVEQGSKLSVIGGTIAIPQVTAQDKYFIDVGGVIPGDTVIDAAGVITGGIAAGVTPTIRGEVATEEPPYVITGPVEIPGLAQVFPFCLPFDVYNFLSALAADPEAPHFEWRFYVPGICDETLEIDLSGFNAVAQILRTMELLAFIVGLAFVTRSRFIRS